MPDGVFSGDGTVNTIPYSDSKPEFAKAHAWPSMEYYGQIIAYVDVERRNAPYLPPVIPEIDSGAMVYRGTHKYGAHMCMWQPWSLVLVWPNHAQLCVYLLQHSLPTSTV